MNSAFRFKAWLCSPALFGDCSGTRASGRLSNLVLALSIWATERIEVMRRLLGVALLLMLAAPAAVAAPHDVDDLFGGRGTVVVDQSQELITSNWAIPFYSPMGQSFVPTLTGFDFVELMMGDATTAPEDGAAYVRIRRDWINGPVIGASEVVPLEDCFALPNPPGCGIAGGGDVEVHFAFSEQVALIPGETYVLEVVAAGGFFGVGNVSIALNDFYPQGTMFSQGSPVAFRDMWFREGMIVPEPGTLSLMLLGSLALACRRVRRP